MRIEWHCDKCGCSGSSENKNLKVASANDGRLARMLHDSVSPNCRPEKAEVSVKVTAHD